MATSNDGLGSGPGERLTSRVPFFYFLCWEFLIVNIASSPSESPLTPRRLNSGLIEVAGSEILRGVERSIYGKLFFGDRRFIFLAQMCLFYTCDLPVVQVKKNTYLFSTSFCEIYLS